jgi:hypothetical protein
MLNTSKMPTFETLLTKTILALEDTNDHLLELDNKANVIEFDNLQKTYSLHAIALITYIINNSETLIEEFIFDITE